MYLTQEQLHTSKNLFYFKSKGEKSNLEKFIYLYLQIRHTSEVFKLKEVTNTAE